MTDHDLIQAARAPTTVYVSRGELYRWLQQIADALEAAVARANQLEKALRGARLAIDPDDWPRVAERVDAILAGVPADDGGES